MSLRYDEKNVNLQCRACNRFDEGNMLGYHKGLIEKYGGGVIDYLDIKRHNTCRMTEFEFKLIGDQYHKKIKELE